MRLVRFIGDVHGKMDEYVSILPEHESIQVGDFGIGFEENPIGRIDPLKDRFIRGNHDYPLGCTLQPNWIADGTYDGQIFFVGGAESTDRVYRTEGKSWWPDEQLSTSDLYKVIDSYVSVKPQIVVSHDAPDPICQYTLGRSMWELSRTQNALGSMWALHKPKLWIYGHYHKDFDGVYEGTRFICLPELEYIDIDVDKYAGREA